MNIRELSTCDVTCARTENVGSQFVFEANCYRGFLFLCQGKQMDETFAEDGNENTIKRRNHAGPLPRALYDLFLSCLRARSSATLPRWQCPWPSGPDLKAAGFPKPKGGLTRREKFKNWAERMDVRFDDEENCEVLVYKRTGKIIVPIEEMEPVVRKVHSQGHYDAKKTFSLVS